MRLNFALALQVEDVSMIVLLTYLLDCMNCTLLCTYTSSHDW